MKAAAFHRYGAPSVIAIEEVERPELGIDDVLVRNEASIVSSAETAARSGSPFVARLCFGLFRPKWPILGNNFAGTVNEVGSGVARFAEFVRVKETTVITHRLPAVSPGESVSVPTVGQQLCPSCAMAHDCRLVRRCSSTVPLERLEVPQCSLCTTLARMSPPCAVRAITILCAHSEQTR